MSILLYHTNFIYRINNTVINIWLTNECVKLAVLALKNLPTKNLKPKQTQGKYKISLYV